MCRDYEWDPFPHSPRIPVNFGSALEGYYEGLECRGQGSGRIGSEMHRAHGSLQMVSECSKG